MWHLRRGFLWGGWGLGLLALGSAWPQADLPWKITFLEEEAPEQFTWKLTLQVPAAWPQEAAVRLVFNWQESGEGYAVLLTAEAMKLVKVKQGRLTPLGNACSFRPGMAGPIRLCLKRRSWKIGLIANGVLYIHAYDAEFTGGRLGCQRPEGGFYIEESLLQPVEDPFFTDDFMRAGNGEGAWEQVWGEWTLSGVHTAKGDPLLSANPFAYRALGRRALATAGNWFWDDYQWEAAVKPVGQGAVGLVAYYQDERNYLLFRWWSAGASGARQLVQVMEGEERLLAVAEGGFEPGQWYLLGMRINEEAWEALVDGEVILSARSLLFGQGQVGLYTAGLTGAYFDDVRVEPWRDFRDGFDFPNAGRWTEVGTPWIIYSASPAEDSQRANGVCLKPDEGGGKILTGQREWQDYAVSASFQSGRARRWGLCFYYQDEDNYLLLRWDGSTAPPESRYHIQLMGWVKGQPYLLGQVPANLPPGQWHTLRAEVYNHYVRAYADGELICEALVGLLKGGQVGLFAEGAPGLQVDNVEVHFLPATVPMVHLVQQFTREQTMSSWATASADWQEPLEVAGVFWHRGEFFGDTTMEALLPAPWGRRGGTTPAPCSLALVLGGDGLNDTSGYRLMVNRLPRDSRWWGEIWREGQRVAGGALPEAHGPRSRLRFLRRGRTLIASVEDVPFVGYMDPHPLPGRRVGLVVPDYPSLRLPPASAWSPQSFDATFNRAPTEWYVQKGIWEVTDRWKCDPRWTWFGGYGHPTPVLWSKRDYAGDMALEFYAGLRMDREDPPYYLHPSDLNATICANGTDLSSGYSFIFAGWGNAVSRIIKGHNQILAESNGPAALFERPGPEGDLNRFHRHWFRIRIEKHGGHLRYAVDDQLVAEATDPEPLEGGKIALWTVHNGLMIARVRLWYERRLPFRPFPDLAALRAEADRGDPQAPASPLQNDFERSLGTWRSFPEEGADSPLLSLDHTTSATGRSSLRITNLTSGGEFAVQAVSEPFDAEQFPWLSFAYRLSGRVAVNVHIKVQGQWHTLGFTFAAEQATAARWLGQIPRVAFDNKWHTGRFDLETALRRFYPAGPIRVEEMVFANRAPDPYLFAGFGGNGFGTTYYLDDFCLRPRGE